MAYDITLTGFTAQQLTDIRDAYVTLMGPPPAGMSDSKFAKLCMFRAIRATVLSWKRKSYDATIKADLTQLEQDYQEDIA